jgi:hypothetical protein
MRSEADELIASLWNEVEAPSLRSQKRRKELPLKIRSDIRLPKERSSKEGFSPTLFSVDQKTSNRP